MDNLNKLVIPLSKIIHILIKASINSVAIDLGLCCYFYI